MGCWNATCGVSQLPICSGNKVKAFLLLQSRYRIEILGSGTNYPMDYFSPFFLPVTATYDDYGSVDDIDEDWNSKFLIETFQKWHSNNYIVNLGNDAEINDPLIDKFEKIKDVFDCVERGALIYGIGDNKRKIGMFMVLEEVYNALLKHYAEDFAKNEYMQEFENDTYEETYKWFRAMRKDRLHKPTRDTDTTSDMSPKMRIDLIIGDCGVPSVEFDHYYDHVKNPMFGDTEEIIQRFKDVRIFDHCMRSLRKMWIPQTGVGNQDVEFEYFLALNTAMSTYINRLAEESEK